MAKRPVKTAAVSVSTTSDAIRRLVQDVRVQGVENTITIKAFKVGPLSIGPFTFVVTTRLPKK